VRPPELTANEDVAVAAHDAVLSDDRVHTHGGRSTAYLDNLHDDEEEQRSQDGGDGENGGQRDLVGRAGGLEEE